MGDSVCGQPRVVAEASVVDGRPAIPRMAGAAVTMQTWSSDELAYTGEGQARGMVPIQGS